MSRITLIMSDRAPITISTPAPVESFTDILVSSKWVHEALMIVTDDGLILKNRIGPLGKIVPIDESGSV